MAFKAVFSEEAYAQLKKMDNLQVSRIIKKIEEAASNPQHFFERLSGRGEFKLRVGDYRMIARIFHEEEQILIMSMDHRKRVYKKLNY